MRIIDPHTHVWINDPAFPWPAENENPPAEDRTAEMLLDLMDAHGVEKTVLVQYIGYRWDNTYVSHVLRTYPDRFAGVCRVNPEDPAAPDHLGRWVEEHGFQGVRLSPSEGPEGDWFRGPFMPPIFQRAEDLEVPLLMLTRSGTASGPGEAPRPVSRISTSWWITWRMQGPTGRTKSRPSSTWPGTLGST